MLACGSFAGLGDALFMMMTMAAGGCGLATAVVGGCIWLAERPTENRD